MLPIPEFENYFVDADGEVWSHRTKSLRKLKGDPRKEDGRLRLTLRRDDGKYIRKYRSHFVLMATKGPRPEGMEACHEDGNCLNDAPENLRWDTSKNNHADKKRHGTTAVGEKSFTAKLSWPQVYEIRAREAEGEYISKLAAEFQVTYQNIWHIVKHLTWKIT